jgi:hypothetical protein
MYESALITDKENVNVNAFVSGCCQRFKIIYTAHTRTMIIVKKLVWCKMKIHNKIIEQVMNFKCLEVEITSNRALQWK